MEILKSILVLVTFGIFVLTNFVIFLALLALCLFLIEKILEKSTRM